jgi:hypothetical protein
MNVPNHAPRSAVIDAIDHHLRETSDNRASSRVPEPLIGFALGRKVLRDLARGARPLRLEDDPPVRD